MAQQRTFGTCLTLDQQRQVTGFHVAASTGNQGRERISLDGVVQGSEVCVREMGRNVHECSGRWIVRRGMLAANSLTL